MSHTSIKIFAPLFALELLEGLASAGIAALDLPAANPLAQTFKEGNNSIVLSFNLDFKDAENRQNVQNANTHLRAINIEALDLATCLNDDNYRRPIQGRGPMCSVTMANGRVKIMDYAGKILMDVNPKKFEDLPCIAEFFDLFEDLPMDIRNKIWGMAQELSGRLIVACEVGVGAWQVACVGRSLFHVAKSVQSDLQQSGLFESIFYKPTTGEIIFFDPQNDGLYLTARPCLVFRTSHASNWAGFHDFSAIQHLTLDLELVERFLPRVIRNLQSMVSLSTVEVRGRGRATHPSDLFFEFIDINRDGLGLVPQVMYPTGIQVAGTQVLADICEYIEHDLEKHRLNALWGMMRLIYYVVQTMPYTVQVTIHYD